MRVLLDDVARSSDMNDSISGRLASTNYTVKRLVQLSGPDGSGKRPDGVMLFAWKKVGSWCEHARTLADW